MFEKHRVKLHSWQMSNFKINCDCLNFSDLECLAFLVSKRIQFSEVVPVRERVNQFAAILSKYEKKSRKELPLLLVDDVFITGSSMKEAKLKLAQDKQNCIGVVIFSRGKCPLWIQPIFQMW